MPESLQSALASFIIFPRFGIGHGISHDSAFMPTKTVKEWEKQERVEAEIAAHTIMDRLGALALLDGRLQGIEVTCNRSNHPHDIHTLKKYKKHFVYSNQE